MKAIFCVGDSHITALRDGYHARRRDGRTASFGEWREMQNARWYDGQKHVVSAEYDAEWIKVMSEVDLSAVFLCFGGGEHVLITLVNRWPFALYCPGDVPQEKAVGSGEVIPFELMHATCASYVEMVLPLVRHLRGITSLPMYHVLPPPPTASDDYHGRYPNEVIRELVAQFGVVPAPLRHKVWRICNAVARRMYEGLGISVIEPPADTMDDRGYLELRYRADDMAHGNADYGALVVDRLISIAESHETRKTG